MVYFIIAPFNPKIKEKGWCYFYEIHETAKWFRKCFQVAWQTKKTVACKENNRMGHG